MYLCELKGNLVYMVSCRIASTMFKEALSKQTRKKEERKEGKICERHCIYESIKVRWRGHIEIG